jgi:hypothetical protein
MKNIDQRVSEINADPNRADLIMALESELKDVCAEEMDKGASEHDIIEALIEELGPKDLILRLERIRGLGDEDEETDDEAYSEYGNGAEVLLGPECPSCNGFELAHEEGCPGQNNLISVAPNQCPDCMKTFSECACTPIIDGNYEDY